MACQRIPHVANDNARKYKALVMPQLKSILSVMMQNWKIYQVSLENMCNPELYVKTEQ